MPTASPAPDAPLPLDAAWSTFSGRKAAVRIFVAGYCAARDRRDAPLHDGPDGQVVQFDAGMGRPFEHFVIEGAPADGDGPFRVGAWITRFGAARLTIRLMALRRTSQRLTGVSFSFRSKLHAAPPSNLLLSPNREIPHRTTLIPSDRRPAHPSSWPRSCIPVDRAIARRAHRQPRLAPDDNPMETAT
ncbi:hypothetical protein [Burkholderia sp. BCC0405]|uniref:hypothetical protein n=1 Tax=Burkholderia sp. BCC0405 TaxID=2676298 RepID=UPI001FC7E8C7|nr:hypothetical protein [Burkholderia sp. BCC0405]